MSFSVSEPSTRTSTGLSWSGSRSMRIVFRSVTVRGARFGGAGVYFVGRDCSCRRSRGSARWARSFPMKRREFLSTTARGVAAVCLSSKMISPSFAAPALPQKFSASDTVTLGRTGIQTSRLAMGTGTVGVGHHSHQTALGMKGLVDLLENGYDHGLRFFDAADSYGSHPYVREALKQVPRDKVTVLTKSWARDPAAMRADLDRFRKELGTDYIDVFLMHCLTEGDWTERYKGVMDVLSEAKQKGMIRAHGCSCHSIEALRAAAASPWVEVDLARINPSGAYMDANPDV